MFLSAMVASALVLSAPTGNVNPHSVQYFDLQRNITNRVLDRSIIPDVERVHAPTQSELTGSLREAALRRAAQKVKRNKERLQDHCKNRLNAERIPYGAVECYLGA